MKGRSVCARVDVRRVSDIFFFSSRRRHTRFDCDWSSDVCSSDLGSVVLIEGETGIGKTRLVQEFVAHVRSLGGVLALNGRERAAGAQLPYGILAEIGRASCRERV